jgi:hypothetical protein
MAKLRNFIDERVEAFAETESIREKYEWLSHYHNKTLKKLKLVPK